MNRDNPIVDSAIKKALRGMVSGPKGSCPDDNLLTAYLENRLSAQENDLVEDHLSCCSPCQETVSLSIKLAASEGPLADETVTRRRKTVLFQFSLPLSALALVVVVVAAGILFYEMQRSHKTDLAVPIAQVQQPAQTTPAAPEVRDHAGSTDSEFRAKLAARRDELASDSRSRGMRAGKEESGRKGAAAPAVTAEEVMKRAADLDQKPREQDKVAARGEGQGIQNQNAEPAVIRGQQGGIKEGEGLLQAGAGGRDQKQQAAGSFGAVQTSALEKNEQQKPLPSPQSALMAFAQEPQALPAKARQAINMNDRKLENIQGGPYSKIQSTRSVGSKTFHMISGYWIDSECRAFSNAPVVEAGETDPVFQEIQKSIPEIATLRSANTPVLIHWKEKNYVLRLR